MSAHAFITKGFRLRTRRTTPGKPANTVSEWLVAPYMSTAPSATVGEVRESASALERYRGMPEPGQNLSDIIEALFAAGNLETRQVDTPDPATLEQDILMVSADDPAMIENARLLIELLDQRLGDLEKAEMERIIEAVVPSLMDRPPPAFIDQARRNAEARSAFMRKYEVLDADQVHELYGSKARNRSALAARWRSDKKIFAVQRGGRFLYPAFQFDAQGLPRKVISRVLAALGAAVGGWQTALWFVTPNGWLDGEKPVDLLERKPDAVLDAAADVAEPAVY